MSHLSKTARPASRAPSTTPPATVPIATRKSRSQPTVTLAREDAIAAAPGDLKVPEKAIGYLSSQGYAPPDAELSLATLSFILLQLAAASGSATDSNGIKAVAFLLEEISTHGLAMSLADRIMGRINEQVSEVAQTLVSAKAKEVEYFRTSALEQKKGLEVVRAEVSKATEQMERSRDGLEGTTNSLENAVGEVAEFFKTSIDQISEQVLAITSHEAPANSQTATRSPATSSTPADPFSYAAATRQHLPSTHASIISRNNDKRRQFTIHPAGPTDDMGLGLLSELEIVAKLQLAFETMTVEKVTAPTDIRFTSVRRMKKGGIIFDLNSDAAADWLRDEATQKNFTEHFSATAVVTGYQFRVLVEFVPVSFEADSPYASTQLEEANNLPAGSITDIGWVKKAERRSANQQVAHLKLSFSRIEHANLAIEKGLSIQGKGVSVRQMVVEPQRCAKCQLYGHNNNKGAPHYARDCAWTHDVCGLCGGMHRTSTCEAPMPASARCANCMVGEKHEFRGHTVHSRSCPTFGDLKSRYAEKNASQQYRFFVTEDTKTWETTVSNPMPAPRPAYQDEQYYPAPPPNQLQRPDYPRPQQQQYVQAPPRRRPAVSRTGPRGMQMSATNTVPLGQTNLNRWMAIAETLTEQDAVDDEIEGNTGGITVGAVTNNATAIPGATAWADDTSTGLPPLPKTTTDAPTPHLAPSTPVQPSTLPSTRAHSVLPSPMRFPSAPPTTPKTVS